MVRLSHHSVTCCVWIVYVVDMTKLQSAGGRSKQRIGTRTSSFVSPLMSWRLCSCNWSRAASHDARLARISALAIVLEREGKGMRECERSVGSECAVHIYKHDSNLYVGPAFFSSSIIRSRVGWNADRASNPDSRKVAAISQASFSIEERNSVHLNGSESSSGVAVPSVSTSVAARTTDAGEGV